MSSVKEYIRHLHTVHTNSLTDESPTVEAPEGSIKLNLHLHQKIVLKRMETFEAEMSRGKLTRNEIMFSNYGILGDSVGAGKSLMILGHIARLPHLAPLNYHKSIMPSSSSNLFSISTNVYSDISEANSLIIVPHTLFRQWSDYITKQTNLSHFCVARVNQIDSPEFFTNLFAANVVLISNTLMKTFFQKAKDVKWKRIFLDEADTIHITSSHSMPVARFYWFVTATWINMIYPNNTLYLDRHYIEENIFNPESRYKHLYDHFKSRIGTNTYYIVESLRIKSVSFCKDILSSSHRNRSAVVINCSKELIEKSISLPPLHKQIIWCRSLLTHQIIKHAVSNEIQQMLHAGDVASALESLGVKGQDTKTLIEAVTANLKKELERLEKTHAFKESMEYSTPQAKELALKSLVEKMERTKASIKGIEERVQNFATEVCPICYDEPNDHLITPCCSRVFCAPCILFSIARNPECPLCRGPIHPSECKKLLLENTNAIVNDAPKEEILLKKNEALVKILGDNPEGRFLIFSRYENSLENIKASIDSVGLETRQLKGSKDTIAATIRAFDSGSVKCLLLNSQFMGAGLNIVGATHVILLHAMSHEEEKQILGRSYRLGRKGPLTFIKLLNKGEDTYTGSED